MQIRFHIWIARDIHNQVHAIIADQVRQIGGHGNLKLTRARQPWRRRITVCNADDLNRRDVVQQIEQGAAAAPCSKNGDPGVVGSFHSVFLLWER
jgi:hypothetical protein